MECICKVIIKSEYGYIAKIAYSYAPLKKCWLNQAMEEWPQLSVLTKTMFYIIICGLGVMALVEVIDQLLPALLLAWNPPLKEAVAQQKSDIFSAKKWRNVQFCIQSPV